MITVLLSGGLDSVAALHAVRGQGEIRAICFSYGQPHRDSEMYAAQVIAERRGVPFTSALLPELGRLNPEAPDDASGLSGAFVPGRNAIFLSRAASAFAKRGMSLTLVCGANASDASGFPDCRQAFFRAMGIALSEAFSGFCRVRIETPWLLYPKASIVNWCSSRPDALRDIRDSVSCYRGTRCGRCSACALRAAAFAENNLQDGDSQTVLCGGDPGRDAALKP